MPGSRNPSGYSRQACRSGPNIGSGAPAGPKPVPRPTRCRRGDSLPDPGDEGLRTPSPPAPVPPRRNALRCIRGRNGTSVRAIRTPWRKLRGVFCCFLRFSGKVLIWLGSNFDEGLNVPLAPLCPAGHLPYKGGDQLGAGSLAVLNVAADPTRSHGDEGVGERSLRLDEKNPGTPGFSNESVPKRLERLRFSSNCKNALNLCSGAFPDGKPVSPFPGKALSLFGYFFERRGVATL
ncbi:hypothetical protein GGQ73_000093 [Rhizobium skierniewicense]|uniref:Uncharacterized protein n=1 Tax=Rhizobium skierniewicense TaxID=984260 RepID=A0A7W6C1T6_9HYPH|nr:hypothetical protein [Rhizobium skierniewicense]